MKVSNLSIKQNMIYQNRRNYQELIKTEKQLTTGKRYHRVSEHPAQAITSIYSKIRTNQINQFVKNAEDSESYIQVAHDKLSQVTKMMHQIKELTIQSANGTLGSQDRLYVATELEELIKEIVSLANSTYQDNYLFSGSKDVKPFEIETALNSTLGQEVVGEVSYRGDHVFQSREIGQNEQVTISLPGSRAFWAENNSLVSLKDNTGFRSVRNQKIRIDGYEVQIEQNDNLERVIDKINQTVSTVEAFKQELPNGAVTMGIESRFPHKIFLEDVEGGQFLREVGFLQQGWSGNQPPNNLHANVLEHGGSLFHNLIGLREAILSNNKEDIGGRYLLGVDQSINHLLRNQAKISSVSFRLENVRQDLSQEKVTLVERISKSEDMDLAEATVRFNELNNVHQLGLRTAAKYIRPTLLDYL